VQCIFFVKHSVEKRNRKIELRILYYTDLTNSDEERAGAEKQTIARNKHGLGTVGRRVSGTTR